MWNRKKIIVINGYLASGKSTFAEKLVDTFQIPCFIKDNFKTAISKNIELNSREEKSRFSVVTFDAMMYVVEQMMKCGYPLIIEGNFMPTWSKKTDEQGQIKNLIERYNYKALNLQFVGDTKVLHERFIERENSEERGNANRVGELVSHERFESWCHNMNGFDICDNTVTIDTTDFSKVPFDKYMERVNSFLLQ